MTSPSLRQLNDFISISYTIVCHYVDFEWDCLFVFVYITNNVGAQNYVFFPFGENFSILYEDLNLKQMISRPFVLVSVSI